MKEYYLESELDKDIFTENETTELIKESKAHVEQLEEGVSLEHLNFANKLEEVEQNYRIVGNPYEDMKTWSSQSELNSCVIACQEMIAEQLTGENYSEEKMIAIAKEHGWYDPECGTSMEDVGRLLEEMGMEVIYETDATIKDLAQALEDGKVICEVNNMILAEPELNNLPGQKANHVVWVIGIDASNPEDVMVILNDPGIENGCGIYYNLETFINAWNTSGNYMTTVVQED